MSYKNKKNSPFKKFMYETMKVLSEKDEDDKESDKLDEPTDDKGEDESSETDDDSDLPDNSDEDTLSDENSEDKSDDLDIEQELQPRATDTIVDNEILRRLAQAEQAGLTVAAQEEIQGKKFGIDKNVKESFIYKKSLTKLLFEENESDTLNKNEIILDVETYAFNVARLIKNYMNLLDMEKTIFIKAHNYLRDKYSSEVANNFDEIMATNHGISFKPEQSVPDMYAVGAYSTQQS